MRSFRIGTLVLTAAVFSGVPAWAAENDRIVPEEGAVQVMLLRQKSVRDELKLTEDETRKIQSFTSQQWRKARSIDNLPADQRDYQFAEMTKENERFLSAVLEPAERKRLDEITLQVAGLLWVTQPKIAAELKLTDPQKQRAKELQQEARKEMQDLIHSTSREARKQKSQELRVNSRRRLLELLTEDQEARWKVLAGAPFNGELLFEPTAQGTQ